jgi:hypothetical protein
MRPYALSESTLTKIRELVEANFAGRDELYAAVETLDDGASKDICRRLAEHLAAHGTELAQILIANQDFQFDLADIEFIDDLSERTFLEMVKEVHGEACVLASIEQCERNLKNKYERMLKSMPETKADAEAGAVLQRQRDQVEFGENVVHTMHKATDKPNDADSR